MSDAFITASFLVISGGFQDAYTYFCRGKVFANAQTGNVVLMGAHLFKGEFSEALYYLVPIIFFSAGILVSEAVRRWLRGMRRLHWRQLILAIEIPLLGAVGFLPQSANIIANAVVSFVCAMQVQSFRKIGGYTYASTMCIGNLRSGTEALCAYIFTGDRGAVKKCAKYLGVILIFALGAGAGSLMSGFFAERAVWLCCAFLSVSFFIMFAKNDE